MATRRKRDADSAARIRSDQLVDLIEDVRNSLAQGAATPATLEAALALLEAEALRRNIEMTSVPEPCMVVAPAEQADQELVRTVLLLSARSQNLFDFVGALHDADLAALWFGFRLAHSFADEHERLLALSQVAQRVTKWLEPDPVRACEIEDQRTERLSEVRNPLAWLEQEIFRLFHQTLYFGGDPTKPFFGNDATNSR